MSSTSESNQTHIKLCLHHQLRQKLEKAAGFEGTSLIQFIVTSALAEADKTIRRHETMRLNQQDAAAFFKALDENQSFNENLQGALQEHDQRVTIK